MPASVGAEAVTRRRRAHHLRAVGSAVRVLAATIVVVACAVAAPDQLAGVGYGAAFVWVPVAAGVEALRRRADEGRPREQLIATAAAALTDVAALTVVVLVAPTTAPFLAWIPFLMVALYGQSDVRLGAVVAAAAVGMAAAAQQQIPLPGNDLMVLGLYGTTLIGVTWLQRGWQTSQAETSTALSLAHGRAEAVISTIADAVVVTGAGGRIRELNPAAARTLECSTDVSATPRCHEVLELRHGGALLDCSAGCPLLDRSGADDAGVEVSRMLATGAVQPLLATAKVLHDAAGRPVEVVHSLRDISELKRAQEAQTLFLATATHELKTPLTLILGYAEMLRTRTDIDEHNRQVALETIHRRATELDRIVEQLLLSSRIGSGRLLLTTVVGDVTSVVQEAVGTLAAVTDRPLTFEVDGAPTEVHHSADALSTLLDHLLDNALKYSPDGGPIEVRLTTTDDTVDLSVRDHGIGMTAEQQERCFDRFWQAEHDAVRRFAGTGLGLYIVRSLATAMGAGLSIESAPGEGTTFRIHLRRADRDPAAEPRDAVVLPRVGERTMVDEFLRQAGLRGAAS